MLPSTSVHVPPGQYPPFAAITETDHSAWIIIAAAFGLSMILLAGGIRVFIRLTISRGWGVDDTLFAVSNLVAWVQTSLILVACSRGLGKSLHLIPATAVDGIERLCYGSNLLFVLSLGLSKASVGLFLLRVTPVKRQRQFLIAWIGFIGIWTVAAFFSTAFQCGVSQPWILVGRNCKGLPITQELLEVLASIFEVAIILTAIWIIWGIQTSVDKKSIIVMAFSFRLAMLIATGFRLGSFDKAGLAINPTLLEASYICWTQTEMNYSIVSATVPSATKLVKSLSTNYGVAYGVTSSAAYGSTSKQSGNRYTDGANNETIPLSSLKSIRQRMSGNTSGKDQFRILTSKEDMNYSYEIGSSQNTPKRSVHAIDRVTSQTKPCSADTFSLESGESQEMIIRKDVTYQVQRDSPTPGRAL